MKAREDGSALVAVILVTLIFFIIAVVVSSVVTLQARTAYEEELAGMSFYIADAGVRLAAVRAIYRFFMRDLYGTGAETFPKSMATVDPQYSANYILNVFPLQALASDPEGYTNSNLVSCESRIYRQPGDVLIARRTVMAEVYLREDNVNGGVDAKFKDYYEENR